MSYSNFVSYLKTTSYYEMLGAWYVNNNNNNVLKLQDVSTVYKQTITEILDKKKITIDPSENFWLEAAKQGYRFYRYGYFKSNIDGFLVYTLLVEHFYTLLRSGDLFSQQVPEITIEQLLLMTMIAGDDFELLKDLLPQDKVSLLLLCLLSMDKAKELQLNNNVVVMNIKTLTQEIMRHSFSVFDSLFAMNFDRVFDVASENKKA